MKNKIRLALEIFLLVAVVILGLELKHSRAELDYQVPYYNNQIVAKWIGTNYAELEIYVDGFKLISFHPRDSLQDDIFIYQKNGFGITATYDKKKDSFEVTRGVVIGSTAWLLVYNDSGEIEKKAFAASNVPGATVPPTNPPPASSMAPPPAQPPTPQPADLATSPPSSTDHRADLKTALADIARLKRAGDLVKLWQAYLPPDQLAKVPPEQIQQMQTDQANWAKMAQEPQTLKTQDPILQQRIKEYQSTLAMFKRDDESAAQAIEAMEAQIPTLNAAGDEATYIYAVPGSNTRKPFVLVEINGKWYVKQGI